MSTALEFLIYPTTNSSFTVYDGTSVICQSNGTVVTATLTSIPRPIKMRFRGGPAAGVERDGVRLTSFTNANGFVEVTFYLTGGTTEITFGPDSDSDGMPDSWEQTWFGGAANPSDDPDGDGLTNLQEYQAGTNPLDGTNYLRIASILSGSLTFPSVTGLLYRVETADDLVSNVWTTLSNNVPGSGNLLQISDPGASNLLRRFYRVRLLP